MGYCKDCLWFCEIFNTQGNSLDFCLCVLKRNFLTKKDLQTEQNCFEENKNSKTP